MKYKDEFHIASTAILLCAAMLGISVVVPKESRVPTAQTTLQEAPETAAEAAAEQQAEFPIYTQESNYDTSDDSGQDINYYDDSQSDTSYDTSGSDYEDVAGNTDGSDNTGSSDSADGSGDTSYDGSNSGDSSDTSGSDQITYPSDDSQGNSQDIPDYTEDASADYGQEDSSVWEDSTTGGEDNGGDTSGEDIEYYE